MRRVPAEAVKNTKNAAGHEFCFKRFRNQSEKPGFEASSNRLKLIGIDRDDQNRSIPFTRLVERAYSVRGNEFQDRGDSCKNPDEKRFVGGRA